MKKISMSNIEKILHIDKKKASKKVKLPELKPDTFEKQATSANLNKPMDSTENLEFARKKVKFYDEDLKKMESMNLNERVEYQAKLKAEHKYTYYDDNEL